jgi:DNA-binding CsgD family transcriptional regulator
MASDRQPPGLLVGRMREVAEIEQVLDRVAAGAPWTVELCGEPGIGKSRLLSETCRLGEDRRFLVLDGRAAEFERDIPFGVFVDALNDYVGSLGPAALRALDADALDELASILPSLSELAGERAVSNGSAQRYRAHYAIRALLERLAKSQPVLLALDDLHWADEASLEVLVHLLRRFRGPLLIALAFRRAPSRLSAALEATSRAGVGSRLELAPLTLDEASAMLASDLDGDAREAMYLESGGNPFYLEQLARNQVGGAPFARLDQELLDEGWAVPPSVIAAIASELNHLDEEVRVVTDAAAVAGESFDPGLVGAIAEQDEPAVLAALDELLAVDLIRPTAVPRNFRFRHPIVRRVGYEEMPAGWRIGAHARAAATLGAAHASKSELAHHVARSAPVGDETAIGLLVDAAREAATRAPLTSGRWLRAAARLLPGDNHAPRVRLLGQAGALLTSGGGFDEALESLEEALVLAPAEHVGVRGALFAKRAEARRRGGRPFDSRPQLEQAVASLSDADDPNFLEVRSELAMNRYWHGDFEKVHELAAEVLVTARRHEDQLLVCLAASLCSLASSCLSDMARARAELLEAQAALAALPDERLAERIYITHYISEAAVRLERPDDALSHFHRGLDLARMTGQDATTRSWSGVAAYAFLLEGRVAEAAAVAQDDFDPAALAADSFRMMILLVADSLTAFWQGRSERMLDLAKELVTRSARTHPKTIFPGLARLRLGAALFAAGEPERCSEEVGALDDEPGRWILDLDSGHGWDVLIRAKLALGELEAAADLARRAESRAGDLPQRAATIRSARAAVLLAAGDGAAAVEAAAEAVGLSEPTGNPLLSARCRMLFGNTLAASGEREQGIAELRGAEHVLAECGAVREADAAAHHLRALGERVQRRPRPDRGAGLAALSSREREVAAEVAAGKTNRDIAATLFLSEKTIESHLSRIYSKLDVHSRAALTAIVARQGTDSTKAPVP